MAKDTSAAQVVPLHEAPDFTKAIPLQYWALPVGEFFGNKTNRLVTAGGTYEDGMISGKCESILKLPDGSVVLKIMTGWQPGKLDKELNLIPRYVVCVGGCHGVVAQ